MDAAAAPVPDKETPADGPALDALYHLVLAPFPFERRILCKARLIKNMRLDSVVEMFSSGQTGSGQMSVKGFAANYDIAVEGDLALLRLLETLPSFDEYSLRIALRHSKFAIPPDIERPARDNDLLDSLLADFLRPVASQLFPGEPPGFAALLAAARADEAIRGRFADYAARLGAEPDVVLAFLEDYADIVLSLCFYRQCLEKLMPAIDDLLKSVRDIRAASKPLHDMLLLDTLKIVEGTVNEMIADVTGRIESFDSSTRTIWLNMTAEMFATLPQRLREYQKGIASILCALSVKMGRWSELFPRPGTGSPARRANFIISEMRQGMQYIHSLLNAVPLLAEGNMCDRGNGTT